MENNDVNVSPEFPDSPHCNGFRRLKRLADRVDDLARKPREDSAAFRNDRGVKGAKDTKDKVAKGVTGARGATAHFQATYVVSLIAKIQPKEFMM